MQNLLIVNVPQRHSATVAHELEVAALPVQASVFARGTVACTGSEFWQAGTDGKPKASRAG